MNCSIIIVNSIIGEKEKDRVEDIIMSTLSHIDYNNYTVINDKDIDTFILFLCEDKIRILSEYFDKIGILVEKRDLSLDIILDKISISGIDSLDRYEKIYLNEYK
jgi:hypothetical protein